VNCLLKQHNSHLWSLLYQFFSTIMVKLTNRTYFWAAFYSCPMENTCIILRKRKSAPVRTHDLPDTPYIKIHPLHFSTQCHLYYYCTVFVVAGICSWIHHEMRSIQFSHAKIRYHCAQTLKVLSIPLSQIHSTWYHPAC